MSVATVGGSVSRRSCPLSLPSVVSVSDCCSQTTTTRRCYSPASMFSARLLFLALVAFAMGAKKEDSNKFMDSVLLEKLPPLIKSSLKLYPFATVQDYKFKVSRTGFTNRELGAFIQSGAIRGFDDGIRRLGDCAIPTLVSGNTSISCVLDFNGLSASFNGLVSGDSLAAITKMVKINVTVVDTTGRIEASALPDKPGVVRTFYVEEINLRTSYSSNLNLNRARRNMFVHEVEMKVHSALYHLLYGEYLHLLNQAVQSVSLPRL